MHDFLSDGISNVSSISPFVRCSTKIIKFQKFDLENDGQGLEVEERDFHSSTGDVRFHVGDFFIILVTWKHSLTHKVTARDMGDDIGKICKVDLPKNL